MSLLLVAMPMMLSDATADLHGNQPWPDWAIGLGPRQVECGVCTLGLQPPPEVRWGWVCGIWDRSPGGTSFHSFSKGLLLEANKSPNVTETGQGVPEGIQRGKYLHRVWIGPLTYSKRVKNILKHVLLYPHQ